VSERGSVKDDVDDGKRLLGSLCLGGLPNHFVRPRVFPRVSVLAAAKRLGERCDGLALDVPYVYNPLDYAWDAHALYCERFGRGTRRALLVGMNPGPHGMAQTGVPFGDVVFVRDWMGIHALIRQPARLHPKRPITGFATKRREPSGSRLYGWAQERFGTAERFFGEFFVVNYCPLLFFDAEGKNLTPPQLGRARVEAVEKVCDDHLAEVVRALRPEFVVGVGGFAREKAEIAVATAGSSAKVGTVLHPSPASPAANRGWARQAEEQLRALGVLPASADAAARPR